MPFKPGPAHREATWKLPWREQRRRPMRLKRELPVVASQKFWKDILFALHPENSEDVVFSETPSISVHLLCENLLRIPCDREGHTALSRKQNLCHNSKGNSSCKRDWKTPFNESCDLAFSNQQNSLQSLIWIGTGRHSASQRQSFFRKKLMIPSRTVLTHRK